ncbi:MAG: ABC transporter substrate-binding protein [Granulosicoccus sp.]
MKHALLKTTAVAIALSAPTAAFADKANDTLFVAFTKELESVDSYMNSAREGIVLQRAIWDGLLYRDPVNNEYIGNLATAWEWIDDLTIEFKLREGVTFHNGEAFNADDVVYTIDFVANPDNGVKTQRNVNWMKSAEKIDEYTVRIHLKSAFPSAIEFLAGPVSIYPDEYYADVGPSGMALKPVGTGPYKVADVIPGQHYVLEKNDNYHDSPKGDAQIGRVDIRTIPDINTQMAEMFNGTLDLIWQVPADQADKLGEMTQFQAVNESTMRVGFLLLDAAGKSDEETPFKNIRVRQAVAHAIDRQAIVDALLKGSSQVINSSCFPSQFGCDTDVKTYEYDPEKSKALLTEAGYPDGFTTDFYAYRDRDYAEAISSFLNAVGITTNFNMLKYAALRDLSATQGVPVNFQTWGSYSINDTSAFTGQFFKFGDLDTVQDPDLRDALEIADTSTNPKVRIEHYSKALNLIADQAYMVPMFSYNTNYVFTQEVSYTPTPDEVLRFATMNWK